MRRRAALPFASPLALALVGLAGLLPAPIASAQTLGPAEITQRVGIDQKLGARLPADLLFRDERGNDVRLGELLGDRPLVLALVYYECPMLCGLAMEGLTRNLRVLGLQPGRDFDIVNVSIDPDETPAIAAARKERYLSDYGRDGAEVRAGWHVLTGQQEAIHALAETVGFRYVYLPETDEYAHGAAIMVVTPEGVVSRYYYGIEYPARDLRLGLVEAADGRIGSLTDQLLLLCYHYDPLTGRYGFVIWSALRLGGAVTVVAMVLFILISLRRERSGARASIAHGGSGT